MTARRRSAARQPAMRRRAQQMAVRLALTDRHQAREDLLGQLAQEWEQHAQTRNRLDLLRGDYAELLCAARAAMAADRDGEADPMAYIRGVLEARHQDPAPGMHPPELLAASRKALALIGVAR
jgi:hypothetical protein